MYPFLRFAKELFVHRNAPPLAMTQTHVSHHICWPWDIDPWRELNNGRTLTLYDLGRTVLFARAGIIAMMRAKRWIGTIAGASIRYRHRLRAFERFELHSRVVGWDDRFVYVEQAMVRHGRCMSHGLLRMAVVSADGLVATADLAAALGIPQESPPLPDWIAAWIAAEAKRPWPPMDLAVSPG